MKMIFGDFSVHLVSPSLYGYSSIANAISIKMANQMLRRTNGEINNNINLNCVVHFFCLSKRNEPKNPPAETAQTMLQPACPNEHSFRQVLKKY